MKNRYISVLPCSDTWTYSLQHIRYTKRSPPHTNAFGRSCDYEYLSLPQWWNCTNSTDSPDESNADPRTIGNNQYGR